MELHDLTALEQAAAIRRGRTSAEELTRHYLARSHRCNDEFGAFTILVDDRAIGQARAADEAVADATGDADLPVLHGVVVPVKDLNATAGVRTRFGSPVVDIVPDFDDDVVTALRAGNTVMTGKTTTPEFGLPAYTESDVGPYARTPWDRTRGAGGSSGGAAVAVAAGLAPVAQGSDGGGSIRIPASSCGVVGVKTSRGLISNGPMPDHPSGLAVNGVLARTVADAAALLGVLTGRDRDYLRRLYDGPPGEPAALRPTGALRIGRYATPVIARTDVHPQVLAAYDLASDLLADLGHEVIDVGVPIPIEAVPTFELVWAAIAASVPVPPEYESKLRPLTRWLRERGSAISDDDLRAALARMRAYGEAAIASTADCDVVLTPTLAALPAPVGSLRDDADPAADFEAQKRFTPFTSPYNISGQPAVSVPLHWTPDGLPVGVQLVGRPMGEVVVLAVAAALERERPWVDRHPAAW